MDFAKGGGFIGAAVLMAFGIILLFACDSGVSGGLKSIERLTLDKTELIIVISEEGPATETLTTIVSPSEANRSGLNWSSSNEKVVTVDRSGKVTALSAGKAVVTVQSGNGKKAECRVSVHLGSAKLEFGLDKSGGFYTVTGIGSETGSVIAIPSKYQGKPVQAISNESFYRYESLTSIIIPSSVETIGRETFKNCRNLNSVVLSDSVKTIGTGVFGGCISLKNIELSKSIETVEYGTFAGCESLSSITLPDSVKTIGELAFMGCTELSSVVLPDSIKTIGESAFAGCKSLKNITIPKFVETIGDGAFWGCRSLNSMKLPNLIRRIGNVAFAGCTSLKSITIPGSVRTIGEKAFRNCKFLKSVELPSSVITMEKEVFYKCSPSLEVSYKGKKIPSGWHKDWDLLNSDIGTRVKVKFLNQN